MDMRGIEGTENISWRSQKQKFEVFIKQNSKVKVLGVGRTLIEALMKRDWCKANNWSKYTGGLTYIQKQKNHYVICKSNKYYGSFKTLSACMQERDCLVKYNWDFDLMVELE